MMIIKVGLSQKNENRQNGSLSTGIASVSSSQAPAGPSVDAIPVGVSPFLAIF